MPLTPGTKLGSYEVVSPIGAGGMGEVYKATDIRLDRTVALKVLPSEYSNNDELRQRLEPEARAVSSLNHPHICTLYDVHLRQGSGGQVGRENGVDFLVMEYLEGETLYDRLKKVLSLWSRRFSTEGGIQPVWSPAGGELFYRQGSRMMVVEMTETPELTAGRPRALLEGRYATGNANNPNYAVSPDGRRFLMVEEDPSSLGFNVVLNAFAGVE